MKTAGMVLGIVGSSIGILFVLVLFLFSYLTTAVQEETVIYPYESESVELSTPDANGNSYSDDIATLPPTPRVKIVTESEGSPLALMLLTPTLLLSVVLLGSVLGLTGAILSRKKAVLGGVLMLIGAVLNLFDIIGFILLLLGGIFVLIPPKQTNTAELI